MERSRAWGEVFIGVEVAYGGTDSDHGFRPIKRFRVALGVAFVLEWGPIGSERRQFWLRAQGSEERKHGYGSGVLMVGVRGIRGRARGIGGSRISRDLWVLRGGEAAAGLGERHGQAGCPAWRGSSS